MHRRVARANDDETPRLSEGVRNPVGFQAT